MSEETYDACFFHDSRNVYLVTGGSDGVLRFFSGSTLVYSLPLDARARGIQRVASAGDLLACVCMGQLVVYRVTPWTAEVVWLSARLYLARDVAFAPGPTLVVATTTAIDVYTYDFTLEHYVPMEVMPTCIAISLDHRLCAIGLENGDVRIASIDAYAFYPVKHTPIPEESSRSATDNCRRVRFADDSLVFAVDRGTTAEVIAYNVHTQRVDQLFATPGWVLALDACSFQGVTYLVTGGVGGVTVYNHTARITIAKYATAMPVAAVKLYEKQLFWSEFEGHNVHTHVEAMFRPRLTGPEC
ncbi:hypothetical protein DICA4_E10374 [Diutina catenulata]